MEKKSKLSYAKSVNSDSKTVSGYVSTFGWDRDQERFVKGAWDFSNYMKNPVVLWSHDISQPPIAKNISLTEDEFGVMAVSEFDVKSEKAMQIFSLFERKFLNAFSVGFLRKDFVMEESKGAKGIAITKAELYEYSAVSVPANPGALVGRELAELAIKAMGKKYIETIKTKSMGEQFLVIGPGDEPETPAGDPIEQPATDEPATTPETPAPVEPAAPAVEFEPSLKQIIELARMAKGNPISEKQRILLTSAITIFNDLVVEHQEDLTPVEMKELMRVMVEFAGVTALIYPEASAKIAKTISQIEKAMTGVPA